MLEGMNIFVVDDDESVLELLCMTLELLGADHVLFARNGSEALNLLLSDATRIDCILLDIQMPKINGIELCKALRSLPAYRNIPVIMLTAMSDKKYIDRALAAGATDYITKPFEMVQLKARLGAARTLSTKIEEGRVLEERVHALSDGILHQQHIGLSDTFDIDDVPGYLNYDRFKQLVKGFGDSGQRNGEFIALQVDDIQSIYRRCGPSGYFNFISDVSDAFSNTLSGFGFLFSYLGNGAFVVFDPSGKTSIDKSNLARQIVREIEDLNVVYPDGAEISVSLRQSPPFGFDGVLLDHVSAPHSAFHPSPNSGAG